jgi:hypothetical protein
MTEMRTSRPLAGYTKLNKIRNVIEKKNFYTLSWISLIIQNKSEIFGVNNILQPLSHKY